MQGICREGAFSGKYIERLPSNTNIAGYRMRIVSGRVELKLRNTPSASGRLADQLVRNVDTIPLFRATAQVRSTLTSR
jgi:hypothetical protein